MKEIKNEVGTQPQHSVNRSRLMKGGSGNSWDLGEILG